VVETQQRPDVPVDEHVSVAPGVRLHTRRFGPVPRAGSPVFLLVHGLASNARLWDGVGARLAADGHTAVAVDLRGHGESDRPDSGYGVATVADDLARLCEAAGLASPVVAGQSWGGNVVLELAARHPGVPRALALVDGGWIHLSDVFADFDACWAVLAPPVLTELAAATLRGRLRAMHPDWPDTGIDGALGNFEVRPDGTVRARLTRDRHRAVLHGLWEHRPREVYPKVDVPVLLMPAHGPEPAGTEDARTARNRALVREAEAALPRASVRWYPGAHHDLHAQHPVRVARDLESLL
jgi:pimeloyl-ACP methyl ester carboxylesterase